MRHEEHGRRKKPCVKCGKNETIPSSSYCKDCQREYNRGRSVRIKKLAQEAHKVVEPESDIVNRVMEADYETV